MMTDMSTPVDERNPQVIANTIIGERVHTHMWRSGRTQKQLSALLGVTQGAVSNRLRGKTMWSASEILAVAAWIDVPVTDLMPEMEIVGPNGPDDPGGAVPPVGLEPTTCGLKARRTHLKSAPDTVAA